MFANTSVNVFVWFNLCWDLYWHSLLTTRVSLRMPTPRYIALFSKNRYYIIHSHGWRLNYWRKLSRICTGWILAAMTNYLHWAQRSTTTFHFLLMRWRWFIVDFAPKFTRWKWRVYTFQKSDAFRLFSEPKILANVCFFPRIDCLLNDFLQP